MNKIQIGDLVMVTAGKDKGKQGKVIGVLPSKDAVVVDGLNQYTKHIKPYGDRPGQKVLLSRPLNMAKIAIINDRGEIDRVGFQFSADGVKQRIFKKSKTVIISNLSDKKEEKKTVKLNKKND